MCRKRRGFVALRALENWPAASLQITPSPVNLWSATPSSCHIRQRCAMVGQEPFFLLDLYASKHESVDLQGSRYLLWCGLLLTGSALGALHCRRTEASGEHCCMQELSKAITCLINVYVCYFTISIMDGCCPAERGRYSLRKGLFFSTLRLAWHVRAYTASESFPTSIRVRTWRWQILNPTVVAVARQMP